MLGKAHITVQKYKNSSFSIHMSEAKCKIKWKVSKEMLQKMFEKTKTGEMAE